jgi:HEAT repeat protein
MRHRPLLITAAALLVFAPLAIAGQLSPEDAARQADTLAELTKTLAIEMDDSARFAEVQRQLMQTKSVETRRRMLELSLATAKQQLEPLLLSVLAHDADAGLRGQAATALGRLGSEKSLAALAEAAANDRETSLTIGDVQAQSSARRAATFALAELAARLPKLREEAIAKLRALPDMDSPDDPESLADARLQALYQIERDDKLLKPFFDRLASKDARQRERGVVAFRFLKLATAPSGLIETLKDQDSGVRMWSALVLGEIADPQAVDLLKQVADNPKEDPHVQANAKLSLERIQAAATVKKP